MFVVICPRGWNKVTASQAGTHPRAETRQGEADLDDEIAIVAVFVFTEARIQARKRFGSRL
jgi:hypothetical protein